MILAIGAQFSAQNGASAHSVNSFNIASSIIDEQVDLVALASNLDVRSLTPVIVAQLQGIFLWEYFAVYRSQRPGVHKSKHFAALYNHLLAAELLHDRHQNQPLSSRGADDDEIVDRVVWILQESLIRLLLSCFIVDTHRCTFYHQPALRPLPPDAILPRPCAHELWSAESVLAWEEATYSGRTSPTPTPFKVNLGHALNLHLSGSVNLSTITRRNNDLVQQHPSTDENASITAWTLRLASAAPVRALIIVAAEGSYAGAQVSEADWMSAKTRLRAWASSPAATADLYAAGRILISFFAQEPDSELLGVGLELDWCLYVAALTLWAYANASTADMPPPHRAGISTIDKGKQRTGSMGMASLPRSAENMTTALQAHPGSAPTRQAVFLSSQLFPDLAAAQVQSFDFSPASKDPDDLAALQQMLQALSVDDRDSLLQLKGCRFAAPVLKAVRIVVARGGLNLMKGLLLAEAEAVLAALIDVEEGRRGSALLVF